MDCQTAKLTYYLIESNEASEQEIKYFNDHISFCRECRKHLDEIKNTLDTYKSVSAKPEISPEVKLMVINDLPDSKSVTQVSFTHKPNITRIFFRSAAAVTILICTGLLLTNPAKNTKTNVKITQPAKAENIFTLNNTNNFDALLNNAGEDITDVNNILSQLSGIEENTSGTDAAREAGYYKEEAVQLIKGLQEDLYAIKPYSDT